MTSMTMFIQSLNPYNFVQI